MAQIALNAAGGRAATVSAKVPDQTMTRLMRLAALAGVRRSAVVRQAIAAGLDALERESTGPPGKT